jgi:dTDP-4-amino-4,6-dideoxygalactose transaminase
MAAKTSVKDLAVFGGPKIFNDFERSVGKPNVANKNEFLEQAARILDSQTLTNGGPQVKEFERQICAYLRVRNTIVVNNATIGLQVAAKALKLSGEVIVPSFTFIATAQAFDWIGINVVFCDIDPLTLSFDLAHLESLITSDTTAIVPVHVFGRVVDVNAIEAIAKRHSLKVVYDAAHAFGSKSANGQFVGNFGDCEVFSFHATKVLNSFEGGCICTNNDTLAENIRSSINFSFVTYDQTASAPGTNAKMTEICAAHGIVSLRSFNDVLVHNALISDIYRKRLGLICGITLLYGLTTNEQCNCHYVAIAWNAQILSVSRDSLLNVLLSEGCRGRRYFYPGCHQLEPFASRNPPGRCSVPKTERLCSQVVCLPNGLHVSSEDANLICDVIEFVVTNGAAIKERMN